ncbi:hypothetical protein ACJ72_08850 [Emergomyces africanus]|uniref:Uncharacterized protein n=1 Tax=Emergomyces africanus TaxID=1955775 RepID=A0A1B7NJR4_9EURO|nr:hypothetical protein ACJ72_08850 [Emergomyces africanus]
MRARAFIFCEITAGEDMLNHKMDGAVGMQLMKIMMMVSAASVKIMTPEMMKDEEKKTVKKFSVKSSGKENKKKKFKEFS